MSKAELFEILSKMEKTHKKETKMGKFKMTPNFVIGARDLSQEKFGKQRKEVAAVKAVKEKKNKKG
jgi:hypothetical protein